MQRKIPTLLVVLALLMVSCGADGSDQGVEPGPVPSETVTTTSPSTTATTQPPTTTTEPARPDETNVAAFLVDFVLARQAGDSVDAFLSPNAAENYAGGDVLLYGNIDDFWVGSIQAADANSFEAVLRLDSEDDSRFEGVGAGPGENLLGQVRPLIVRFAVPIAAPFEPVPTTVGASITGEEIVARLQTDLQQDFDEQDDVPDWILGPMMLECSAIGPVEVGDIFACAGVPQTDPPHQLDAVGIVYLVVSDEGAVSWSEGTDMPDDIQFVYDAYAQIGSGLYCRDFFDEGTAVHPFGAATTTPENGYFWTLVYWFLEGQPARMDADANGIPCETVFPADAVEAVWAGS